MREPAPAAQLADLLSRERLDFEPFRDLASLMRALRHRRGFDLALIDIGHEPAHEERVRSWLRCRSGDDDTPAVILVSSHWNARRVALALEAGADDCVAKPFDGMELLARIKAVLRRSGTARAARTRIEWAGFTLDRNEGSLLDRGQPVKLTPREFALAWLFFGSPGRCLGRDAIGLAVWGADKDVANRTIEQHVYKLRRKIKLGHSRGVVLRTSYGQGYRLEYSADRVRSLCKTPVEVQRPASLDAEPLAALA